MKVGIIVPRIIQLGPIIVMTNIVNSISRFKDVNIEVYYLSGMISPGNEINVPVKKFKKKDFNFRSFDIIHTTGFKPDLLAFLFRKKINKHISTIHNYVFADLRYTYNRLVSVFIGYVWLMLWRSSDKLVCVSGSLEKYYSKKIPKNKLITIYNGIDPIYDYGHLNSSIEKKIESLKENGFRVLGTASIITKRKGIEQLIRLLSASEKYALIVMGDGRELKNLKKLSSKLKIQNKCIFLGYIDKARRYYRLVDIFVFPSRSEGFGLALSEAAHAKIPVVCSDIDVFKELFNEDEISFFRLDDQKSLYEAIEKAYEFGFRKTDKASKKAEKRYNSDIMARQYYNTYQSLLK